MSTSITFDQQAISQLDRMFAAHSRELTDLARTMTRQMNGMGRVGMPGLPGVRATETIEDAATELRRFISILNQGKQTLTATEKYNLNAAKRELQATNERIKAAEEERRSREQNRDSLDDSTRGQEDNTNQIRHATNRLAGFAESIVGGTISFTAMTRAVNEFSQAYKHGLNWNAMSDSINAALQMGMSPKDMMDFQARFRRVSNTLDGGIAEFNTNISKSNAEWLKYTGSLKDASTAQAEFADLALSMGVGANNVKSAVGGMFSEFKKLQIATSMTAEEFVATQRTLMAEKSVRDKLVGLQGKERVNYMMKLTDTAYMFQTLGLQKEAAEGLVKALEQQSGKTGISRLTEGAQLQAVAGIIGMNQSGSRIRELATKRNRSKDENEEFSKLMSEMSQRIESRKNSSLFGELQMNALEKTFSGALETVNTIGAPVALAKGAEANPVAIEKQRLEIAQRDSGVFSVIKESLVKIVDILGGWSQSAMAALLAVGAGRLALGRGGNLLSRVLGGVQGAAAGGPGAGPGPGLGGAAGAGRLLGSVTSMLRVGGIAAIVGMAASTAAGLVIKDEKTKSIADSTITGASLGATVGSFGGPLGIAIGTAVGGLGGFVVGMINNQETLEDGLNKQKNQIIEQTSLDEARYKMAKNQYQTEINQLQQKAALTAEEQKRLDDLKAKMAEAEQQHGATQAKLSAASVGYGIAKQQEAQDWISQTAGSIKGGKWWGGNTSEEDTNQFISQLAGKLAGAGLNLTEADVRNQFGSILEKMAANENWGSDKQTALLQAKDSIINGTGNYNTSIANPLLAQALQEYQSQVGVGFSAQNQAMFATKFNTPEAIAGLQEQVKAASDQMEKDKAELATVVAGSRFDDTGMMGLEAAKIQKRIDNSAATLSVLQQLASRDNTVKFESEDKLLEVLQTLSDNLKKSGTTRIKP